MKITIISVGKIKEKYLREGIVEYSKRLRPYCSLEIVEVDDEQAPENLSEAQMLIVKEKEAEKIRKKIREGTVVIALDIRGARLSSEGFASKIENYLNAGKSHITFLIGGSLGLDDNLLRQADFRLSFSDMTFPHQLMRLILLEQIYRAFKIMRGETYHK